MSQRYPRYRMKAGRFIYDLQTKKVKVSKTKGILALSTNEEQQNHVSWVNTDSNVEEIDLIVFPFDAHFEKVAGQNNTFVLRFQSNEDRYFFYLQEKVQPDEFVKKVNQRIAYVPAEEMEVQEPQKQQVQKEVEPVKKQEHQGGKAFNEDFIKRLTNNLMAAQRKGQNNIPHLQAVLSPSIINDLLSELDEEDKQALLQFLPQEQHAMQHIASNVRSPQFQQAADVLTDALNSQNVVPLFMELGLDQKYLKQYFGVHAFLVALQEKAKQKSLEKKQE